MTAIDMYNPFTWPDNPFLSVKGSSGRGTPVAPGFAGFSEGGFPREVILKPINEVMQLQSQGVNLSNLPSMKNLGAIKDLSIDWNPE